MDRIQCSNRLARERLACALDNLWTETEDVPVGSRCRQMRPSIRGFGLRQFAERGRAQEDTLGLDDCEV